MAVKQCGEKTVLCVCECEKENERRERRMN